MATLALELAARGKKLIDPYKEHTEKAAAAGVPFEDLKEAEDHNYSDEEYESEGTAYTNTEESKQQVSFTTTAKMPSKKASFASPSSTMKRAPPPRKLAAITGAIGAPIANGIVAPIVRGEFLSRCTKTRKRFNHYHIRMLFHSFVTADDIMYE
jgi:hypothetical protein